MFQVVRFEPKGFSQRRPYKNHFAWGLVEGWYDQDPESGNYHKLKDDSLFSDKSVKLCSIEPILYRLPELQKGIQDRQTIFIAEGEKDVDNLVALGFIATTCPMGAKKWRSTYTEIFQGCSKVVVLADKDKDGREHANIVSKALFSEGVSVKMLEMPNINNCPVKDFSDWLIAGGTKSRFIELVENCTAWEPQAQDKTMIEESIPSLTSPEFQDLISRFGQPYYLNKQSSRVRINQSFFAGLYQYEHIQFFEPDENEFYHYDQETGLYIPTSEDTIKQEISFRILEASRKHNQPGLECERTNINLQHIVSQLKGISEKKNAFRRDNKIIHLANGVIIFKGNDKVDFCAFSPDFYSRNQSPIAYDPAAKCDRFLNELLYPAVSADDAILIQKYFGLCLLGNNLIQKLLILDGQPGRGKTTLVLIIQKVVGQMNVTELRTKYLNERFELFRYLKKTLLTGIDVPGRFLSEKGAHVIKGLVGGDWFDAEQKGGTGSFQFKGNFCILITSNSRLQVYLDGDTKAWKRRLMIVRVKDTVPSKKIPNFADLLIQEEGSGILNYALQGAAMVLRDIESFGDIKLTEEQNNIVDALLAESDSLRHFVMENIVQDENADLSTTEIVEAYAEYCPQKGWNAKPITIIHKELESLMLELFGTSKSHSIEREGKNVKGFRRVAFKTQGN